MFRPKVDAFAAGAPSDVPQVVIFRNCCRCPASRFSLIARCRCFDEAGFRPLFDLAGVDLRSITLV